LLIVRKRGAGDLLARLLLVRKKRCMWLAVLLGVWRRTSRRSASTRRESYLGWINSGLGE
jgi:hypothetical protein